MSKMLNERFRDDNDSIHVADLFFVLWRNRLIIILTLMACLILSFIYITFKQETYTSEALISAAEDSNPNGISSSMGELSSLASIAGINVGGAVTVDKTVLAVHVLQSREFLVNFIKKHNFESEIFAAESWNKEDNSLIFNAELYDANKKTWLMNNGFGPSDQKLFEKFLSTLEVREGDQLGFYYVSFEHVSPEFAKNLINQLIEDLNETMRSRDKVEAQQALGFLNSQLNSTSVAEFRSVIFQLIEQQTQRLMFSEIRKQYSFNIVDQAFVPEEPSAPNKPLVILLGLVMGVILGCMISVIKSLTFATYVNESKHK